MAERTNTYVIEQAASLESTLWQAVTFSTISSWLAGEQPQKAASMLVISACSELCKLDELKPNQGESGKI